MSPMTRCWDLDQELDNCYRNKQYLWSEMSHMIRHQHPLATQTTLSCCQTLNINNIFWSVSLHSRKSTCQHPQHTCQHPQHTCLHVIMSGPWLPAPPVTVRNSVQPLPGTKSEFASIQSDFAQDRNFFLDKVWTFKLDLDFHNVKLLNWKREIFGIEVEIVL